jgi:NifU-like protein involved in Fe-S cluster formation
VGIVDDRATENLIQLYLLLEHGRVTQARFRTLGCSACIAASSMLTVLVSGLTLDQAAELKQDTILSALDGLPRGKEHCAALAVQALRAALADATLR